MGNTANNAFHNALILSEFAGIESELPIRVFGLRHAISAPAWDSVDFEAKNAEWVSAPDWSSLKEASHVNQIYSDNRVRDEWIEASAQNDAFTTSETNPTAIKSDFGHLLSVVKTRVARHKALSRVLAHRNIRSSTQLDLAADEIAIIYGADSLLKAKVPNPERRTVSFEHGTLRWAVDGAKNLSWVRKMYIKQVKRLPFLWVTNLDSRTLQIAEDIKPGRWSALPHPFMFDDRVPFSTDAQTRDALLRATDSEFLVLLAASQNWTEHHDKGSVLALDAFSELRNQGFPIGLVAVEWGLQLAESKQLLRDRGLSQYVKWISPMPRFPLQRMMANVDTIWDQFGLDAFGALALRALEQGSPLVSRGLKPEGARLIGSQVPWMKAMTVDEIVSHTKSTFSRSREIGREKLIEETQAEYRTWLNRYHSPQLTASLQSPVYEHILRGSLSDIQLHQDAWARALNA